MSELITKSLLLSTVVAVAFFSGCGKDGNIQEVTVKAVDGYVIGATVSDQRGSTASKNGDGTYSFVKAPTYPLTLTGGQLLDTNESFTGTMYATNGTVISPVTTLLTTIDPDGNPTDKISQTELEKLSKLTGLSKDALTSDYMATKNVDVAKVAQAAHIVNQDPDLQAEVKGAIATSNETDGSFDKFTALAKSKIDASTLSDVKKYVFKDIIDATAAFSGANPATLEASIKESKVMLSNMAAVEAMSGDIGSDLESLQTVKALLNIAGNEESNATLTDAQLSLLGADAVVNDATLKTLLIDAIKKTKAPNKIDSEAEVQAVFDNLKTIESVESEKATLSLSGEDGMVAKLKTALSNYNFGVEDLDDYKIYALAKKLKAHTGSDKMLDTYDKIVAELKALLQPFTAHEVSVSVESNTSELYNGQGIDAGSIVATVTTSGDETNTTKVGRYTLANSGDYTKFDINGTTGVITAKEAFDYETQTQYTLTAVAQIVDADDENLTVAQTQKQFTIKVQNVKDFGITKVTYDSKNDNNLSNDEINIYFSAGGVVDEYTLSPSSVTLGVQGAIASGATGVYNSSERKYTITGLSQAPKLAPYNIPAEFDATTVTLSGVTSIDGAPLEVNSAKVKYFVFNGLEYGMVKNPDTNRTWLDRNLGAKQVAESSDDYLAYGDLYQWGRKADGHEKIVWTSGTVGTPVNETTTQLSNEPADSLFITSSSAPYDWRVNPDDTLWAGVDAVNNVCPAGFRLPLNPNSANDSANEWYVETQTWGTQNSTGAISSVLKLPMPGYRYSSDGTVYDEGIYGHYWSGSAYGTSARYLNFYSGGVYPNNNYSRANGFSVRCIKN